MKNISVRWCLPIFVAFAAISFFSCKSKEAQPPVDLSRRGVESVREIEVPYSTMGGVKTIPVKLNGVSMDMIFDTGCSGVSISLHELQTLYKNGKIGTADFIGTTYAQIADGSVVEEARVRLQEIVIGGENGIKIPNIKASVVLNQSAPILLGNDVLDEVSSFEVDNVRKVIKFKRK